MAVDKRIGGTASHGNAGTSKEYLQTIDALGFNCLRPPFLHFLHEAVSRLGPEEKIVIRSVIERMILRNTMKEAETPLQRKWRLQPMNETRQRAHQLIDRMSETQLSGLVRFLETIVAPVSYTLANAPLDDEPFTEEERQAVTEAEEWLRHNEPIPHEQVLAELGLTMSDWEKMVEEQLPGETSRSNG